MQYVSLAEPHHQLDIVAQCCLVAMGLLLIFIFYIIIRAALTKSANLPFAPIHIQRAYAILAWVGTVSVLLSLIAVCFDIHEQLWQAGISGNIEMDRLVWIIPSELVLIGIGLSSALFAMIGVALIYFKRGWLDNNMEPSPAAR